MTELHGVLDVESVGLHGEGFAAALTIIEYRKGIIEHAYFSCPAAAALGSDENRQWLRDNVFSFLPAPTYDTPEQVRNSLWEYYMAWKTKAKLQGATFTLWADCGFPVETRFIAACIDDDMRDREWEGPYPLQEIATIRTALGLDPVLSYDLPEHERHNPITETRYIASKLMEWLDALHNKSK